MHFSESRHKSHPPGCRDTWPWLSSAPTHLGSRALERSHQGSIAPAVPMARHSTARHSTGLARPMASQPKKKTNNMESTEVKTSSKWKELNNWCYQHIVGSFNDNHMAYKDYGSSPQNAESSFNWAVQRDTLGYLLNTWQDATIESVCRMSFANATVNGHLFNYRTLLPCSIKGH